MSSIPRLPSHPTSNPTAHPGGSTSRIHPHPTPQHLSWMIIETSQLEVPVSICPHPRPHVRSPRGEPPGRACLSQTRQTVCLLSSLAPKPFPLPPRDGQALLRPRSGGAARPSRPQSGCSSHRGSQPGGSYPAPASAPALPLLGMPSAGSSRAFTFAFFRPCLPCRLAGSQG